LGPTHLL